jgi:phospholipid transport system transporter-binding protein
MQPKINISSNGEYAIEGVLNNQTVPLISQQFVKLIPAVEGKNITVDLALVSHSDSAGVALLVEVMQLAKSSDLTLLFSNLPKQMKDIAELCGLLDILPYSKN